jgi:hypothetical protein
MRQGWFSNMAEVDMLEFLRLAKRRTTLSHKRFALLRCNWASNQHSGPSPLSEKPWPLQVWELAC